jgi:hypothetical protein
LVFSSAIFLFCFLPDSVADAVGRKDHNALIDLIKKLQSCFTGILNKTYAECFTFPYNVFIMNDHAEHADGHALIFFSCFPGDPDRPDNALTVSSGYDRYDFHLISSSSQNEKNRYNLAVIRKSGSGLFYCTLNRICLESKRKMRRYQ